MLMQSIHKRNLVHVFFFACFLFFMAQSPEAGAGDSETARTHFKKGVKMYNEKDWRGALGHFLLAYKHKPHWKILVNVGNCYLKLNQWADAVMVLTLALEDGGF